MAKRIKEMIIKMQAAAKTILKRTSAIGSRDNVSADAVGSLLSAKNNRAKPITSDPEAAKILLRMSLL